MRIDLYLVENNFFESRTQAKRALTEGAILVDGKTVTKGSLEVNGSEKIEVIKNVLPYVSQGGLKLEGAIADFKLDFTGKVILDIGASTGGFTDCSLKHGASFVYAVDVGSNQLKDSLRADSRVKSLENTNILLLPKFDRKIDIIVMDVSFVSVLNLLSALKYYLEEASYLVLLIKPQFELGKVKLKNGVVKDKKQYLEVLNRVQSAFNLEGLYINKLEYSKILGGSGNKEFVALISKNKSGSLNLLSIVNSYKDN